LLKFHLLDIVPGSPNGLLALATDVEAGEEVSVTKLELSVDYSYTDGDVDNLLKVLPISKVVQINLSVVSLKSPHFSQWSKMTNHWQTIRFQNGHLQSANTESIGKIASRAALFELKDVLVKDGWTEFCKHFPEGLRRGGNCKSVHFSGSTAKEWGGKLRDLSSAISWHVTKDESSHIWINK